MWQRSQHASPTISNNGIKIGYVCVICGYIYDPAEGDPETGIAPGTPFEELPQNWTCPACGVGLEHFEKMQ